MRPNILIHGGAWQWDDALDEGKREGLYEAVRIGKSILEAGGSALDAVEMAVRCLEDDVRFDAGTGGYLNQSGVVELDALITDGRRLDFGSVAGVSTVKNPITLARRVMENTEECFMIGAGADQLSERFGLPSISNIDLHTPHMIATFESYKASMQHDTVGAVAMDNDGNVASATSTSGSPFKPMGRVGDSPLYGSGGYAENKLGAAGATGKGEHIMRLLLSKYACDLLKGEAGDALWSADAALRFAEQRIQNSMCGVILIDAHGRVAAQHTTPKMAIGFINDHGEISVALSAKEMRLRGTRRSD